MTRPERSATAGSGGERTTVLLGFGEAFAAIEAAWSLQQAGFGVLAFARPGAARPLRKVRGVEVVEVPAPELDAGHTLEALARLVRTRRPAAFLPLDDASLWLSRRADLSSCAVVGPDANGVSLALNKETQFEMARRAGLLVPRTTVLGSPTDRFDDAYPSIFKPAEAVHFDGRALSRPNGRICANVGEASQVRASLAEQTILVQPVVKGVGEGIFGYAGVDGPTQWSAHRRVRMLNPSGSASSACVSVDVDPILRSRVDQMLRNVGWQGLFMAEFLRDEDGRPWFMELNGRAWGSLALARRRGLEYPAWATQDALSLPMRPAAPGQLEHLMCRHLGREIAHLGHVLRGPRTTGVASWPSRSRTVKQLLTVRRSDRLYNWDPHQPRVLLSDTWQTVADQATRLMGRNR